MKYEVYRDYDARNFMVVNGDTNEILCIKIIDENVSTNILFSSSLKKPPLRWHGEKGKYLLGTKEISKDEFLKIKTFAEKEVENIFNETKPKDIKDTCGIGWLSLIVKQSLGDYDIES